MHSPMAVSAGSATLPSLASQTTKEDVIRRSAGFHPSIWGNRFLTYTSDDMITKPCIEQEIEELKEKVRKLVFSNNVPSERIYLIDALQRLGIAYHFEREIEESLDQVYATLVDCEDDDELSFVALRFRLLRQQGYNISSDVFGKFRDNEGNLKEALREDVPGMVNLYEAAHLRVHEEDILEDALAFTTTYLHILVTNLSSPLATQVNHALRQPLHKGIPRLEARHFISIYQNDKLRNEALLKLAKVDFNLLQSLHQKELSHISGWWKDLDFATKLPFARDRIVECYFWTLAVYFEPQYSFGRRILTKVIAMASIIDDIYDVYGTPEELELFTEAINRWEINAMDQLPEYMKLCYQALLDVYKEIDHEMMKEGRSYCVNYAKDKMKNLIRAYQSEAKWLQEGYVPTMDEYMQVSLVSSGYSMVTTTSFIGMGEIATEEIFDWLVNDPMIVAASTVIARLMDDMVSHQFEQMREHIASSVECYMKQYGVSEQETVNEFSQRVANAWKDINKVMLRPTDAPMPLFTRVLNLSRMMDVAYKDGDGYTNSAIVVKDYITSLLIDPIGI